MTREEHIMEHEAAIVLDMYQDMISYVVFYRQKNTAKAMSININTKELKTILESTPPGHNIMLSGRHGRAMVTGYGTETWIDS